MCVVHIGDKSRVDALLLGNKSERELSYAAVSREEKTSSGFRVFVSCSPDRSTPC